ncbi:SIS domain-containing protein (plasmid) [Photobacterium sp. GJ3]|uniref:SIS domain-containing protein n=1 Tax=Photobacterium sp. GJ3 TaxID=2829502 RepID=UPI001B8C1B47|nr:SIS domain-containing protein [Photobacterium sp. GJ3]QUJ69497.1 SIS domain-containing protein [Photobacterium sp. GJ3]
MFLGHSIQALQTAGGEATAREISQQPQSWQSALAAVREQLPHITTFLSPLLNQPDLRIVMTGAGTSAFAGRALAPYLSGRTRRRFEAIATTDIVTDPQEYFAETCPTLLISFARSGCSPESVAAVELASQLLPHCYHLVITCNAQGDLYQRSLNDSRTLALLMPEESNDRSFAMTSSLTCMMLSCLAVFQPDTFNPEHFAPVTETCRRILNEQHAAITAVADDPCQRVIYLGSGSLQGIAQEAALKLLELTAGKLLVGFDTPVGFRHGPKSVIDDTTLVVIFISNDPYTRRYDLDLLTELRQDNQARRVIAIADRPDPVIAQGEHFYFPESLNADDATLSFPYLLMAQIYAFSRSVKLGISPDNPCPSGAVNRVVQGVTIYPYQN